MTSFANTLSAGRFREFATAFNFSPTAPPPRPSTRPSRRTVDNYVRQTLEKRPGDQNEGLQFALYFQRKAPTITSVAEHTGRPKPLKVVQTALDIPAATSNSSTSTRR